MSNLGVFQVFVLYAVALGLVYVWTTILILVWHAWGMNASHVKLGIAAAIGALLPFVPELVKLAPSLPPVVANAVCAVVLAIAAAYKLVPSKDGAK